jgi:hypothetical protein
LGEVNIHFTCACHPQQADTSSKFHGVAVDN